MEKSLPNMFILFSEAKERTNVHRAMPGSEGGGPRNNTPSVTGSSGVHGKCSLYFEERLILTYFSVLILSNYFLLLVRLRKQLEDFTLLTSHEQLSFFYT